MQQHRHACHGQIRAHTQRLPGLLRQHCTISCQCAAAELLVVCMKGLPAHLGVAGWFPLPWELQGNPCYFLLGCHTCLTVPCKGSKLLKHAHLAHIAPGALPSHPCCRVRCSGEAAGAQQQLRGASLTSACVLAAPHPSVAAECTLLMHRGPVDGACSKLLWHIHLTANTLISLAQNVRFSYPGGQPAPREVLRGISLRAAPGQSVAIVGSSGSGKSTILRLLVRLYDAAEGSVILDGIDVKDLKQVG